MILFYKTLPVFILMNLVFICHYSTYDENSLSLIQYVPEAQYTLDSCTLLQCLKTGLCEIQWRLEWVSERDQQRGGREE